MGGWEVVGVAGMWWGWLGGGWELWGRMCGGGCEVAGAAARRWGGRLPGVNGGREVVMRLLGDRVAAPWWGVLWCCCEAVWLRGCDLVSLRRGVAARCRGGEVAWL